MKTYAVCQSPNMLTRLAPSPTGALHLGNARTFLITWLLARQNGWRVLLRIEDLDGPRIKPESAAQAMDDLRWLGIDWDDGPVYQSARRKIYADAVEKLLDAGLAYPCVCTRKDVVSATSAPHAEDGSAIYPGTCRGRFGSVAEATTYAGRPPVIRFAVPDETISWNDCFAGFKSYQVARQLGDFVIAKADGTPAYQLSVVVDDIAAGVTHVVRGDDLLDSTPRQILLYRALQKSGSFPSYYHLPLVTGPDGLRLAKRHGDSRLRQYRDRGVPASRVLSLLAKWCGISSLGSWKLDVQRPTSNQDKELQDSEPETAADLLNRFDLGRLSKQPVIHSRIDEAYLLK